MRNRKVCLMAALVAGALAFGARTVQADTITVTSIGTPSGGVFNYDVAFSATADITNGDGFLIADFGAIVGSPAFSIIDGSPPASGNFTLSQPLGGSASSTGLNDQTGSSTNTDDFGTGSNMVTITDSNTVADAVFIYSGTEFIATAGSDLKLTLTSALTGTPNVATSIGVDSSGNSGSGGYSLGEATVYVPAAGSAAPLPASSLGAGALICLLAAYQTRKARMMA